jgi:hypothetical protein
MATTGISGIMGRPTFLDLLTFVPPAPALGKDRRSCRGQAEGVVQLAVGEQAGVGGDPGLVELELEPAAEGDPQGLPRFARRVHHPALIKPLLCL